MPHVRGARVLVARRIRRLVKITLIRTSCTVQLFFKYGSHKHYANA